MNFQTRQKVLDTIHAGDDVNRIRGDNRAKIDKSANGYPPLSESEAKALKIKINIEWGEMARLLQQARRQYEEAILSPSNYFRIRIPKAPQDRRTLWEELITTYINRPMKRSDDYASVKEDQILSLVSHGIGPQTWHTKDKWCPETIAIEDLRVATDTRTSFKNLEWYAARWQPTVGELARKVFGPDAVPYWKKKAIKKLLHDKQQANFETNNYNWIDQPEKMWELFKQNLGYWTSDAAPTIPLWNFYFQETDDPTKTYWKKVVVPDVDMGTSVEAAGEEFLYDAGDKACAQKLSHILHVQFGDLNNKSPRLYYATRSLAFKLLEPCRWTNIARCRGLQHVMENFNIWLRVTDPAGRARAQKVELFNMGIIEEGVAIVPQDERHQVNEPFTKFIFSQLRQLMAEESSAYTQEADTGTSKEETATQVLAKIHQSNAEMSSLLARWFRKEVSAYREICRRFCLSKSSDEDVIEFQKECKDADIPRIWLNPELWDIEPEVPMGAGHPTMQISEAQLVWAVRAALDPTGQQEALHMYLEAVTRSPHIAERLAPIGKLRSMTTGTEWAITIFGSLMQGVPVPHKEGVSKTDQIRSLLGMMSGKIMLLQKPGMADRQSVAGLVRVNQYITELLGEMAGDDTQQEIVREFSDELGKLMNDVKTIGQQLAKGSNGEIDPEAIAKVKTLALTTTAKLKSKQISDAQKLQQGEVKFKADERRKDISLEAQERRDEIKTASDIARDTAVTESDIELQRERTKAEIASQKAKAKAAPEKKESAD